MPDLAKAAVVRERERIMRDLHDVSGHHIVAALFQLAAIERKLCDTVLSPHLEELRKTICQLNEELHAIAAGGVRHGLKSGTLYSSLSGLIDKWERRVAIPVRFQYAATHDLDIPADVEQAILYVAREALTNIAKHASGPSRVTIDLVLSETLVVTIEDDGQTPISAVDTRRFRSGRSLGLAGMAKRVEQRGGALSVGLSDGGGMRIVATIPLADNDFAPAKEVRQ